MNKRRESQGIAIVLNTGTKKGTGYTWFLLRLSSSHADPTSQKKWLGSQQNVGFSVNRLQKHCDS